MIERRHDRDRITFITYVVNSLQEILQKVSERQFFNCLEPLYQLIQISKLLNDPKPTLHLYQLLGTLLQNLGHLDAAYSIFEVAKDLANES